MHQTSLGRAVIGGIFLDSVMLISADGTRWVERHDLPALGCKASVDARLACLPLAFFLGLRSEGKLRASGRRCQLSGEPLLRPIGDEIKRSLESRLVPNLEASAKRVANKRRAAKSSSVQSGSSRLQTQITAFKVFIHERCRGGQPD